ncbi:hypothetical protein Tsubulata_043499 [Turnera subulata]|uniref:Uncharacterized protein n=1 Tax=Turnera subulata TaxID=218843 RepID=A0A9Q0F742_9ROSI|nr:hypothetical protein Tsubulata_043499 [Turnera subulata]
MGTKVHCDSYFPGYFSMRDLNENSNSCSWPFYYGDKTFANAQYYNGFLPSTIADVYPGNEKDAVKRTMLEHEAIFKTQLYELHRLYRIQRDLMDEIKRKELHKNRMAVETSLSSSPLASQITSEEARKWHIPGFPMPNSVCARPSTSGVEESHSPLSSMKGNSAQASPLPSQNGGPTKSVDMLESRPTKVRRKMFDLQLPADEYIDTEESDHFKDANASGISSFLSNRDPKFAPESGTNLFLVNGEKNNCQGDASRSESCVRSTTNMADLNKPIEIEETNTSAYFDVGCSSSLRENRVHELAARPNAHFLGFPKEMNSLHGSSGMTHSNPPLEDNANKKQWFSQMLEAGHGKSNTKPVSQCSQPEKLPQTTQPFQVFFNKARETPGHFVADQIKVDQMREKMACDFDISERNRECPEPVSSSVRSPYPVASSSDVGKSWSDVVLSWEKPGGSLRMQPYVNSSATLSSQASTQSLQWDYNGFLASKSSLGSEVSHRNGFYHGSSSGSKETAGRLSSGNYEYWNCTTANALASEHLINHSSSKLCKSLNCTDLKSPKDLNLNVDLSNSISNGGSHQKVVEVIDLERKHEDRLTALPWLRAKPACKNESMSGGVDLNKVELGFLHSSSSRLCNQNESAEDPNQTVTQNRYSTSFSDAGEGSKIERSNSSSCNKILGFPIFGKPHTPKNESSSFTSPPVTLPRPFEEVDDNSRKGRGLDINLPCDAIVQDCSQQTAPEVVIIEKETDAEVANFRHQIDLNSCVTEDEASVMPTDPCLNMKVVGIDLEAPLLPETEECSISREDHTHTHDEPLQLTHQKAEGPQDELVRIAAEAIVAISSIDQSRGVGNAGCSPQEASTTDPLLDWFAEIVSCYGADVEGEFDADSKGKEEGEENDDTCSEGFDYFVSMTLKLEETKEEDYMPKPLVPENLKLDETGSTPVLTRTRKGQGRRGRQRRDFQRDILPGLASLSRHEVTEDLQTFGGLMRATGQAWQCGLTRRNATRNGCGRGRRRTTQVNVNPSSSVVVTTAPPCIPLIQQLNNIEVGLEDRSLAGWGKTTRRPRRQRCPAGNPPSIPLT